MGFFLVFSFICLSRSSVRKHVSKLKTLFEEVLSLSLGINSTFSQLDSDYCPPSTPVCVNFQSGTYVIKALNGYVSNQNVDHDPDCDGVSGETACGCHQSGRCCSRGYQTTYLMNFPFNSPCNFGGDDPWYSCNADTDMCIRSSTLYSQSGCNHCSANSCQVCLKIS